MTKLARRNAGEGAAGLSKGSRAGQQRTEGREEVRGEEDETKEVTLATAFSRRARELGDSLNVGFRTSLVPLMNAGSNEVRIEITDSVGREIPRWP